MVRVGPVLSPWAAGSRGQYLGIRHGVSRARNFVKWSRYARLFARGAGTALGGYLGAAVGLGSLAYEGYMVARRRFAGRRTRRNVSSRRRPFTRGGARKRPLVGRKRSAARAGLVRPSRRSVVRRRRFVPRVTSVINPGPPEYGGITKFNVKVSRARRMPRKELKLAYRHVTLRWQRMSVMTSTNDPPGSIILDHQTVSTDQTATPCFMFCLNQVNNNTAVTDGPMFQVRFNNSGEVYMLSVKTQNPDGTVATVDGWAYERLDIGSGAARYNMPAWQDVRLMCYGCTKQPTTYDIMVISFNDDYMDPLGVANSAQETSDRHAMYQSMLQPFMSHPLLPSIKAKKAYKVYKRIRFTLQSTLNIENDTDPNAKGIRLFVRDGSVYDYAYHGDGFTGAGADDKLSTVQWVTQQDEVADLSNRPANKARKWLVIRASNTTRSSTEDQSNTPSFDMCVRSSVYCCSK